ECAQPSYYFLRLVSGGDESWRDKLLALAEEQPDNERAQRLAQQVMPYVGYLPDPPDVTAALQRAPEQDSKGERSRDARPRRTREGGLVEGEARKGELLEEEARQGERGMYPATLPNLEAPSNYVAFEWLQRLDVTVARIQKPDPRLPRGRVDYLLWDFEGTRPRVAVTPPAPAVAHEVADLAAQPYRLDAWWGHARRLARQLGPARVEDLLGTMVYPPGVSRVDRPAAWVYRVQVAAALVLAHLDSGWEESVRRKALLALANGPMDWSVDAALVALASLA